MENTYQRPGALGAARKSRVGCWVVTFIVVGVIAVIVGAAWWGMKAMAAARALAAVKATQWVAVTKGTVEKSVESSGKVVSNLDVDIKCRASGEVIKLPFDISMAVKKGELLCQLDPTDEELAVRLAEASLAQAQAKVAQMKDDLKQAEENLVTTRRHDEANLESGKVKATNLRAKANRARELFNQKLMSIEDVETLETDAADAEAAEKSAEIAIDELHQQEIQLDFKKKDVEAAEAQLQASQVTLDSQKQQLAYCTVTAPIDGVVSALDVQKGAMIESGMSGFSGGTTILTLSDLSRVFVTATVDESDIGEVRVNQPAVIKVASFPNREFAGNVTRIATKGVNTSNVVTFEVKVEVLDEHKDLLRPEMTGSVKIILAEKKDVLTLPLAAVSEEGGKNYVTTAKKVKIAVTLGLEGGDNVEVVSGIAEGEKVEVSSEDLPTKWKAADAGAKGAPAK